MRFVYMMDPLESMHPAKDTTFAIMLAAQRAGHENLHCLSHHLWVEDGRAHATVRKATIGGDAPFARYGASLDVALDEVDAVLVRKDPPFDQTYLYATQVLNCARNATFIVNDPRGLRDANEKLYTLSFPEWIPRTIVASDRKRIRQFVDSVGGSAIIKPLDGAGGRGVLLLSAGDLNTPSVIDLLTDEGKRLVMVQEYLPAVREGDKRVLILDGKLLGAVLRVPRSDDLRANIHAGGTVVACSLTDHERKLVESVGPKLRQDGLYFVGLDLIGGYLTEVNVTSPTGLQELGRLTSSTPDAEVVQWLERACAQFSHARRA